MKESKYGVVKFIDNNFELDVNISLSDETVWLNLDQIAGLFKRDKSAISRYIKNIFKENELDKNSTVALFAIVQLKGNRTIIRC